MMNSIKQAVRVYIAQAWLSYHGRFAITSPFGYITSKLGFPFFLMIFFIFMGKFVGFDNPAYIVIGNVLLIPASGGMSGISLAIGDERQWGTLSYVLGSPASRLPIFLGRSFFYILDGFFTSLLGLLLSVWIFHIPLAQIHFGLLLGCIMLLAVTANGLGFLFGSISLLTRDGWTILQTFVSFMFILIGVNFPIESLPGFLSKVGYWLPLTRGVMAARQVLSGASWSSISSLVSGEFLVGMVYILIGYLAFLLIEKQSMSSGTLDAM
jgi:ABC-2 type transport system permease protein